LGARRRRGCNPAAAARHQNRAQCIRGKKWGLSRRINLRKFFAQAMGPFESAVDLNLTTIEDFDLHFDEHFEFHLFGNGYIGFVYTWIRKAKTVYILEKRPRYSGKRRIPL